MLIMVI